MKEERTADQIAEIFTNAGDCVNVINADNDYAAYKSANKLSNLTEVEWKDMIKRNTDHLEIIKTYTEYADNKKSIWTSEDFTAIDAAIVKGKSLYA
tara:strand:- start:615 stop:902 length:288 start_codon:yes stop_codon:yes gene_type:complete